MIVLNSDTKQGVLSVTLKIEAEEFSKALNDAYLEHTDEFIVPGFAAGLAPREEIEKLYGASALYDEALDICVPSLYRKFLSENGLRTAGQPRLINVTWLDNGAAFTVTCDLYPEITLGEELGIETKFNPEDDRENFEADVLSKACANIKVEIPDGIVQQKLDSLLAGEKLRRGQDAVYNLLSDVIWILDKAYRETGVSRSKAQVRAEALDAMLQTVSSENKDTGLLKKLVIELITRYRPLPDDFDKKFDELIQRRSREKNSMQPEERINEAFTAYLGSIDMTEESWRQQNYERAKQSAKIDLLLNAVADKEKISVSESELQDVLKRIGEEVMLEPEEVRAQVELKPILEQIRRDKARDIILKSAVFSPTT